MPLPTVLGICFLDRQKMNNLLSFTNDSAAKEGVR